MTTAILQREIREIEQTQQLLEVKLNVLKKAIDEHEFEEVRPEYLKRLKMIDTSIKQGEGRIFKNSTELKKFFESLLV